MGTIQELIDHNVLVLLPEPEPLAGGTVIICDGETDASRIVPRNVKGSPVRVISNEIGVFACDNEGVVIKPLKRAYSAGFQRVILVVNPKSVWGRLASMSLIKLIDIALRFCNALAERFSNRSTFQCVVHIPSDDGWYKNYIINELEWHVWYGMHEKTALGRNDYNFESIDDSQDDEAFLELGMGAD